MVHTCVPLYTSSLKLICRAYSTGEPGKRIFIVVFRSSNSSIPGMFRKLIPVFQRTEFMNKSELKTNRFTSPDSLWSSAYQNKRPNVTRNNSTSIKGQRTAQLTLIKPWLPILLFSRKVLFLTLMSAFNCTSIPAPLLSLSNPLIILNRSVPATPKCSMDLLSWLLLSSMPEIFRLFTKIWRSKYSMCFRSLVFWLFCSDCEMTSETTKKSTR